MAGGASQSRTGLGDRVYSWQLHHKLSAGDSLRRLLASPISSLMTWLVIGIALALPVGLGVALENARQVSVGWDNSAQISLFLRAEISLEAAERLRTQLDGSPAIELARLVSREQALDEFRQLSGFDEILAHLDENPLPNLLLITPDKDLTSVQVADLQASLLEQPGVERALLDMEWVQRLNALMKLFQRAVWVVGAVFALGVLLVIGNTIRLAIENRRDEILVVKLVGGSNAFVRRPFLYTGFWYGLGGSVFAWIVVGVSLWWLRDPLATLAVLYQSELSLQGLGVSGGLRLLALGGLLGLLGAWLSVSRHLSNIEPS
jgi:cell division transport system permease protein